jgi:protein O-GlcNAc transferase
MSSTTSTFYSQLGIALCREKKWQEAIANFRSALEIEPTALSTRCNLGLALLQINNLEEAVECLQYVIAEDPNFLQARINLGIALSSQNKWQEAISNFEAAIQINPNIVEAYCGLGIALREKEIYDLAIPHFEKAIQLNPQLTEPHLHLGLTLVKINNLEDAINCFVQVLNINPSHSEAYVNLCNTLYTLKDLSSMYAVALDYKYYCDKPDDFRPDLLLIRSSLHLGLYEVAVSSLTELEAKIYNLCDFQVNDNTEILGITNELCDRLSVLYPEILFCLPYLRDDVATNSRLSQLVARSYFHTQTNLISNRITNHKYHQDGSIRIGFISKGFYRMSEGWCNRDVIRELAILNPNIYLYATARFKPDDLTQDFIANSKKLFIPPSLNQQIFLNSEQEIVQEVYNDAIDILVDIDSVLTPIHTKILHSKPAPICLTWQGFEPANISCQNYFFGDWYTHPDGIEEYYYEKLMRLPDSFLSVSGFTCSEIDISAARNSLGVTTNQIIFLCMAIGLKFSKDLVKAHVEILHRVPNSFLLHKGSGDTDTTGIGSDIIRDTYYQECLRMGVAFERIRFLGRTTTEEEHRTIYLIADILLDSYPFNGVTHTLEALWFELPVVTYAGEQLYSRASYSFMKNVGICDGFAYSWSEYTDWAVKLSEDNKLRQNIKEMLIAAKQQDTLAPLWNPHKFAVDFLDILYSIYSDSVS